MNQQDVTSFLRDINAPVKSFRISAIEWVIREGSGSSIRSALEQALATETDEECRILIGHAFAAIDSRSNSTGSPEKRERITPELVRERFLRAEAGERLDLLRRLPAGNVAALSEWAPDWLKRETDPVVAASIIRVFGRCWPADHFLILSERLTAPFLSVRVAALEVLAAASPTLLITELPRLLGSSDPRIRALAIQGLNRIDPQEALLHLEAMLLEGDPAARRAAISNCLLFPFESTKPLLLKFFTIEDQPELLEEAGAVLLTNPDIEIPHRLWETVEAAPRPKALILKKIVEGVCGMIKRAGLLNDDFPAFVERLQQWIQKRAAIRFVQDFLARLSPETDPADEEARTVARGHLANPLIKAAFQAALSWPLSEVQRREVQALLAGSTPTPAPRSATLETPATPAPQRQPESVRPPPAFSDTLSDDEKMRIMAGWDTKNAPTAEPVLTKILKNSRERPAVRAASLRAALRIGLGGFVEFAAQGLQQADPGLLTAGLDYLEKYDPDRVLPRLGTYLSMADPRVQAAALKILKRNDPIQAVSTLIAMLSSKRPQVRTSAFSCMIHFDFSLVRDSLTQTLLATPEAELVQSGICLFQANPDPQNPMALYRLEKGLPLDLQAMVREARLTTEEMLESFEWLPKEPPEAREKKLAAKYAAEQAARATPAAYSLKSVRLSQTSASPAPTTPYRFVLPAAAVVLAIAFLFGEYTLVGSAQPATEETTPRWTALPAIPTECDGTIESVDWNLGEVRLVADPGGTFILPITDFSAFRPKKGMEISARLHPYAKTDSGQLISRAEFLQIKHRSKR